MVSKYGNYKLIFKKYLNVKRAICGGVPGGLPPYFQKFVRGPMGLVLPFLEIKRGQGCSAPLLRRLGTVLVKGIISNIILL